MPTLSECANGISYWYEKQSHILLSVSLSESVLSFRTTIGFDSQRSVKIVNSKSYLDL